MQTYDHYVARYAAAWPAAAEVAGGDAFVADARGRWRITPAGSAGGPTASPAIGLRVPGPNVFFPSAASIPPVNIMSAEPPAQAVGDHRRDACARPAPAQRKAAAPAPSSAGRDRSGGYQPERAARGASSPGAVIHSP